MAEKQILRLLTGRLVPQSTLEYVQVNAKVFLGGKWLRREMLLPRDQAQLLQDGQIHDLTGDDKGEIQVRLDI